MKRHILISMAAATLLSVGLLSVNSTEVNAVVKVGQRNRLTRNSYVYNSLGLRVRKGSLKKGRLVFVSGRKIINGKAYVKIGKNQYIRLSNFSKPKATSSKVSNKSTGVLGHNAYVYDKNGRRLNVKSLKKDNTVTLLRMKTIHGKKYFQIGKNRFIKAANIVTITKIFTNNKNKGNGSNTNGSTKTHSLMNNNTSNNSNSNTSNANSSNSATTTPPNPSNQPGSKILPTFHERPIYVLHTNFVYDKSGNKILGTYATLNRNFFRYELATVNGEKYYYVELGEDADGNDLGCGYIPTSAFDKNGKTPASLKAEAASDEEFIKYDQKLNDIINPIVDKYGERKPVTSTPSYYLASAGEQGAYIVAKWRAKNIARFMYSTINDMQTAIKELQAAKNNLDGRPVIVKGTPYHYTLTDDQKEQIIKLADRYYATNDAHFSPDGTFLIFTKDSQRKTSNINLFINFTD